MVLIIAILYKLRAEQVIWDTENDDFGELKDRVKESWNLLKESLKRVAHLKEKCKRTFETPIKNSDELYDVFKGNQISDFLYSFVLFLEYNNYLYSLLDMHYHMIQIEYPIDQKKAFELAAKISHHNQTIIEEKLKPSAKNLCKMLPKDKELSWNKNYIGKS